MVSQPVGLGTRVSNGTSRGCPGTLWEGTIYFLVLVSLRPGTRAGAKILGQTPLTRLPGTIWLAKKSKNSNFFLFFYWPQRTGQAVKILPWPVPWQDVKMPSRPLQDFELVLLSLCPGIWKDFSPFVPWTRKSCPVGNATWHHKDHIKAWL